MRKESRHVLFVHAHPDDETISTGGTIATLVDAGVEVTVVTCTRGERGEVIPAALAHLEGNGPELAEHREGELAEAMRVLGVDDHRYLGDHGARLADLPPRRYLDSGMVWGDSGKPQAVPDLDSKAFCSAPTEEVAADIAAVIAAIQPDAVVSYDADGGYGHPDHIKAHAATRRAAAVMAVPFYAVQSPQGNGGDNDYAVDVSPVLDRKLRAMQAHHTQITVDGDHYALSSGPSMPVPTTESYRRLDGAGADLPFSQQPWVARALACAVALALGVGVGILGTVTHPSSMVVAGVLVPSGLIVALAVATVLLVGLRLVFGSRAPAIWAALGIVLALLVFAQVGPGGSVLIAADVPGYVWTYGVPLVAAFVIAWPRLPSRAGG